MHQQCLHIDLNLPFLCVTGSVDYSTKREVFSKYMAVCRLQEEKSILLREMKQHWDVLKARASVLSEVSLHHEEGMCQSKCALPAYYYGVSSLYSDTLFFFLR